MVLLVGNHDMASADRAASSLDIFGVLGVPGVIVADREEIHHLTCRRGQLDSTNDKEVRPPQMGNFVRFVIPR